MKKTNAGADYYFGGLFAAVIVAFISTSARAQLIDNINGGATPPNLIWNTNFNGEGWEYTPTKSYALTGIFSYFDPNPPLEGQSSVTETVTVQLESAPGGTVLDQGTFSVSTTTGGLQGATFATPISLTVGTTYFVDFMNFGGVGLNVGQWADTGPGGTPAPSDGATTNLGDWWALAGMDGTTWTESDPTHTGEYATHNGQNLSIDEPILYFYGQAVPEPSTWAMSLGGLALLAFWRLRTRRTDF
jgi:hypothetical protein